ncbi:hypothetical protein A2Z33_04255 [Candidatus Gottesmanbacteria bacterium RBG_16_52_11]|uniref:Type II secretion system protein GspG C-terminal domain-containing protein n=1 Tax=Candidatus Gottesmanbacteria bacterium RBG_16_52_11 TaxID=1798374 RepID=A0A1F5YVW3_9BACT|nr:MAG: hypothetical protein A2Z33_04255 [Candidatus Gottesmanbacteria bacterium RBG_16_52_11]
MRRKLNLSRQSSGMSFMELLIVIAMMALAFSFAYTNWKGQLQKGFDAKRKGNLNRIQAVLEHYANDNGCYPPAAAMTCGTTIFAAYNMPNLLCDPESKAAYLYEQVDPADPCKGYRLYATVKIWRDNDVERLGCNDPAQGCCSSGGAGYNYGVSAGAKVNQCP